MTSEKTCPFCDKNFNVSTLRMYQKYIDHLESHAEAPAIDCAAMKQDNQRIGSEYDEQVIRQRPSPFSHGEPGIKERLSFLETSKIEELRRRNQKLLEND